MEPHRTLQRDGGHVGGSSRPPVGRPAGALQGQKERLAPLVKWLELVRDCLRDLVTARDQVVDETRGVMACAGPRVRKEYDAERLAAAFPRLAGCIKPAVNTDQLEGCLRAGMMTEGELKREGVMVRTLHSRAPSSRHLARAVLRL